MSDEELRELERTWAESGAAEDEVAYRLALARHRPEVPQSEALRPLLEHPRAEVRRAALRLVAGLSREQVTWEVAFPAAKCLEAEDTHEAASELFLRMAARGDPLKAAIQVCVHALGRDEEVSARCIGFLQRVAAGLKAGGDRSEDLEPYAGKLVDAIARRDPSPAAEVAATLLLAFAEAKGQQLSTSLYARWTELKGPAFDRLVAGLNAIDPAIVQKARRQPADRSPVPASNVLERLARNGGPFLVVEGQYSPQPQRSVRLGVFELGEAVADVWVTPADRARLEAGLAGLGEVRLGEWDVMYATAWAWVWTTDGGPFQLWGRDGLVLEQEERGLSSRSHGAIALERIERVEAYLEEAWTVRGVRLRLRSGASVPVAEETDPIPLLDPTYDGINLMCEAAWVTSLARAVAASIGVPCELDPDLR